MCLEEEEQHAVNNRPNNKNNEKQNLTKNKDSVELRKLPINMQKPKINSV